MKQMKTQIKEIFNTTSNKECQIVKIEKAEMKCLSDIKFIATIKLKQIIPMVSFRTMKRINKKLNDIGYELGCFFVADNEIYISKV